MIPNWLLPWAAGFFDGEGYIGVYRFIDTRYKTTFPRHSLVIAAHNSDQRPIDNFKELFGGVVDTQGGTKKKVWRWRTASNNAVKALLLMSPWFSVKKEQSEAAIDFQILMNITKQTGGRHVPWEDIATRDAYYWRLRNLKKGVPL